jgi:hypothetical protein
MSKVGEAVEVERFPGSYYKATIRRVDWAQEQYFIAYTGLKGDASAEWVDFKKVREIAREPEYKPPVAGQQEWSTQDRQSTRRLRRDNNGGDGVDVAPDRPDRSNLTSRMERQEQQDVSKKIQRVEELVNVLAEELDAKTARLELRGGGEPNEHIIKEITTLSQELQTVTELANTQQHDIQQLQGENRDQREAVCTLLLHATCFCKRLNATGLTMSNVTDRRTNGYAGKNRHGRRCA